MKFPTIREASKVPHAHMVGETHNHVNGFTLFEILIVMGIMGLILAIGAVNYNAYTKKQIITQESLTLKDAMRNAATSASAGQKPVGITCAHLLGYEMSFTETSYTTVAICNPDAPDAPSKTVQLNPILSFNPVPDPILFQVLNRGISTRSVKTASESATLTLSTSDGSTSYHMSVGSDASVSIIGF